MEESHNSRLFLLAPLLVLAHVLEEGPRFLSWLNRRVEADMTMDSFIVINAIGVLITASLAVPAVRSRDSVLAFLLIAWLSFVMLANGILHLVASLVWREYVPGSITAGVFYLPYFVIVLVAIYRRFDVSIRFTAIAIVAGATPMAAHGISILTAGRPLLW